MLDGASDKRSYINSIISGLGENRDKISIANPELFETFTGKEILEGMTYMLTSAAMHSSKKVDEVAEAIKNFRCRPSECHMGGAGEGIEKIENWFKWVADAGKAWENGRITDDAWKNMSQLFKETGSSSLNKAKGATETLALIHKKLDEGYEVLKVEEKVAGAVKTGKNRQYDVVIKNTTTGKIENIEVKAWNPSPRGTYNPDHLGDMLFLNFKGKISSDDIRKLEDAGLSPDDIKQLIDNSGQLFEDLGQAIQKAANSQGVLEEGLFNKIEHFWYFDGRLNDTYKSDMVDRLISKLQGSKGLFQTFISGLGLDPEKIRPANLENLLEYIFKSNI